MPLPLTIGTGRVLLGSPPTYAQRISALFGSSMIGYWRQAEPSGTVAIDSSGNNRNGTYTGVTLGAAGIGDGSTAASFDGTTSFNNVYSAPLAGAFNGAAGTVAGWCKASGAGIWTDGLVHRVAHFRVDANNNASIYKTTTNNTLTYDYIAGGTTKTVSSTAGGGNTSWFFLALTWSVAANAMMAYYNGAQVGTTQTGLGTWAGSLLSTATVLGSQNTGPAQVWSGSLAHAILLNRAATAAEVAQAYIV